MFPVADFLSLSFLVMAVATLLFALMLHELGHVLAGSLAGLRIVAAGLGVRRPFVRLRLFGICFYLGYPLGDGLTVAATGRLRVPGHLLAIFIAGGPAANLLTAGASLALWHLGMRFHLVAAFFYSSMLCLLVNLLPFTFRAGLATLRSDGLRAVQLWRGTWVQWQSPGQQLETLAALRDLCRTLDAWPGVVAYTLATALWQAGLEDHESAQETLSDDCLRDPRRGSFAQGLEAYVRAAVMVVAEPFHAMSQIEEARRACDEDP